MWALLFSSILQRTRRNQRRPRNPLRRRSSSTMQRDRHLGTLDLLHRSFLGEPVVAAGSSSTPSISLHTSYLLWIWTNLLLLVGLLLLVRLLLLVGLLTVILLTVGLEMVSIR